MKRIEIRYSDVYKKRILEDFMLIVKYLMDERLEEWGEHISCFYHSTDTEAEEELIVYSKALSFSVLDRLPNGVSRKCYDFIETIIDGNEPDIDTFVADSSLYDGICAIASIVIDWLKIKESYRETFDRYKENLGWIRNFIV